VDDLGIPLIHHQLRIENGMQPDSTVDPYRLLLSNCIVPLSNYIVWLSNSRFSLSDWIVSRFIWSIFDCVFIAIGAFSMLKWSAWLWFYRSLCPSGLVVSGE
jgi:hypothetical protein